MESVDKVKKAALLIQEALAELQDVVGGFDAEVIRVEFGVEEEIEEELG